MGSVRDIEQWRSQILEDSEAILATLAQDGDQKGSQPTNLDSATVTDAKVGEILRSSPWAFSTRRVDRSVAQTILPSATPQAGDLVLARVDALGHHANLQLTDGRRRRLFPGDTIVVAYGNRYACEQFEARVPDHLGPCHLVAGGGIASHAISWHTRISRGPTRITPLGILGTKEGRALNLRDFAIKAPSKDQNRSSASPSVIAILGTAMDAGKTQTAAFLLRGLRSAGYRVGYVKITGTGAGGDTWLLQDAGADRVLDFTDAGMASTYLADMPQIEAAMDTLLGDMAIQGMDIVVMEVADGVYQRETAQLIAGKTFARAVDGMVLAARDAMGASAGVSVAGASGVPILALSGLLCASPLQRREAEAATGIASADREELATASIAQGLFDQIKIGQLNQEVCA